jgi:uncharacterized protein YndB with AHSA1/START domain
MLKIIGIVLGVIVLLLVGGGLVLPTDYALARSVVIEASPEQVHELVGDLTAWPRWTPWMEEDPSIETTFGSATTGVGASQEWTGESGGGNLTFTKCDPGAGIEYDMAFVQDGEEMPSTGFLHYSNEDSGTKVTWGMKGDVDQPLIGGYFAIMMDSFLVGPLFEKGLVKLKDEVEKSAQQQ